jgi:hypothetical protein
MCKNTAAMKIIIVTVYKNSYKIVSNIFGTRKINDE